MHYHSFLSVVVVVGTVIPEHNTNFNYIYLSKRMCYFLLQINSGTINQNETALLSSLISETQI